MTERMEAMQARIDELSERTAALTEQLRSLSASDSPEEERKGVSPTPDIFDLYLAAFGD
jgi:C4-dicarboxylate-specific signal transduction histidine kinase